ncbi:alpha/beta hydrolase family protein [Thalassotalea euphylliae]|uniref:alpha/beta hydrolase family protein n=1 Tax=Thalassotalea euphylliae TaxID=1655234 RepID=UPI003636AB13
MYKKLLLVAVLCCSTAFSTFSLQSQPLPVEYFASLPDVSSVSLSPDGKHIISLVRVNTEKHQGKLVQLVDTVSNAKTNLAFSDNEKYKIRHLQWINNQYVAVYADFPASRFGTPVTESRVMKLDVSSGELKPIIPRNILKKMVWMSNDLDNIIDVLPEDNEHILMSMGGFTTGGEESVIRISLSGKKKSAFVQRTKNFVGDWITDNDGNVRVGIAKEDARFRILEKRSDTGKWRDLWEFDAFAADSVWPIAFGADKDVLYVSALHNGKDAIFKVNLKDESLTKELVYFNEHYDVTGRLRKSGVTGEVIGVGNHFWHPTWEKFQKGIDKALPDTTNHIISLSKDETKYIVLATNDTEPGIYLLGDRKAGGMDVLAYRYNNLTPEVLSAKKEIKYSARDGLEIEGYLTVPAGKEQKNLPTIIFPHGGPISYDDDGFDYWTQFLASRGYAVLQMNFRGSSGYGHDFMQQGLKSWGKAMQDDVEDGARWLIEQGIADKDRICILGASYGGYAALMGGVKSPDLYRCIVSFAGVTDIEYMVKKARYYTNYDIVKKQIGSDHDELWENSPLKHAEKIKQPVLLIHGEKDRVVRVAHSEKMFDELKGEGKNVNYVELEGGDHYLSNNRHRLQTFKEIESFLSKYNPATM